MRRTFISTPVFAFAILSAIGCSSSSPASDPSGTGTGTKTEDTDGGSGAPTTKQRFVAEAAAEDSADWDGSPIRVESAGVAFAMSGGIRIVAVPGSTRVKAKARLLAMAFEKADADASLDDARESFVIERRDGAIVVVCDHGGTHGWSSSQESGCEHIEVAVPAGTASMPLDMTVSNGNGELTLELAGATIARLDGRSKNGAVNAALSATKGGRITLLAEGGDDVTAKLPADWAADEVILEGGEIANAFEDVEAGPGAGGRGAPGTGLALLKLTSEEFAGLAGKLTLH